MIARTSFALTFSRIVSGALAMLALIINLITRVVLA